MAATEPVNIVLLGNNNVALQLHRFRENWLQLLFIYKNCYYKIGFVDSNSELGIK